MGKGCGEDGEDRSSRLFTVSLRPAMFCLYLLSSDSFEFPSCLRIPSNPISTFPPGIIIVSFVILICSVLQMRWRKNDNESFFCSEKFCQEEFSGGKKHFDWSIILLARRTGFALECWSPSVTAERTKLDGPLAVAFPFAAFFRDGIETRDKPPTHLRLDRVKTKLGFTAMAPR